ncbi:DNA-binding protein [Leptospira noguchii]|uniref:LA_0442/LA_0875 N-terminal domain-containing protein n=1 Tax=Leptospira noguchii TaxID=28182 RepID=UPI001FB6E7E8|nr:DNA-binding protein [Leptospira noguchii]UOG37139.1 DNA-binding protein [Leptospira noguchii]
MSAMFQKFLQLIPKYKLKMIKQPQEKSGVLFQNKSFFIKGASFLFLWISLFTNLDAKSILLKNGRMINQVNVKTVPNGFEITHKNGKVEKIPLTEVQKVFISDRAPIPVKNQETVKNQEVIKTNPVPNLEISKEESIPKNREKKSGVRVFAEGLIPGWSRLLRNDSYYVKGLGVFFVFAELFFVYKSYIYLSPVKQAIETNQPPTPLDLIASLSGDQNLMSLATSFSLYDKSKQVVLSDGQLLTKDRYAFEKEGFTRGLILILILDAFLGYKFENWEVVPNVNVSYKDREISGGVTIRF